ncbi:MAG: GNAT family N-acetyltransferase [Ilumatobacteraceae bacterium]
MPDWTVTEVAAVSPELREAYFTALRNPQPLYAEQQVSLGRRYRLADGPRVAGYAVVTADTIVERHVTADATGNLPGLLDAVRAETGARHLLCKSFDSTAMAVARSRPAQLATIGYLFLQVERTTGTAHPACRSRLGSPADAEHVLSMHDGFFEDRAEVERYATDGRLFLYELPNGDLAGCGILTRVVDGHDAVDLGMVVAAPHRGQGIGTYIATHLANLCDSAGDQPIAGCAVDNHASRRALERSGFSVSHRLLLASF